MNCEWISGQTQKQHTQTIAGPQSPFKSNLPVSYFMGSFFSTSFCWSLIVVFFFGCKIGCESQDTRHHSYWYLCWGFFLRVYLFSVVLKYDVSPDGQSWNKKLDQLQILIVSRKTSCLKYYDMLMTLRCYLADGQSYIKPFSTFFFLNVFDCLQFCQRKPSVECCISLRPKKMLLNKRWSLCFTAPNSSPSPAQACGLSIQAWINQGEVLLLDTAVYLRNSYSWE